MVRIPQLRLLGSAPGLVTLQYFSPGRASTVLVEFGIHPGFFEWHPIRFGAPALSFHQDLDPTRSLRANLMIGRSLLKPAKSREYGFHRPPAFRSPTAASIAATRASMSSSSIAFAEWSSIESAARTFVDDTGREPAIALSAQEALVR
jgi:hypothetical protein